MSNGGGKATAFLARPDARYREGFLAALRESHAEGALLNLDAARLAADFDGFVRAVLDEEDRAKVRPGGVPQTTFWLIDGGEFIGRSSFRHELTPALREFGGHIGYQIRPSRRRQGYGRAILRLTLDRARGHGLAEVLLTCDADNAGSRTIIEANGGRFADERPNRHGGSPIRRYWITLG